MTKDQAIDIGVLAMDLLPRTTASQAKELVEAVEPYPFHKVEQAVREHARTNESDPNRLCIPAVLEILKRPAAVDPNERIEREKLAASERIRLAEEEKQRTSAHINLFTRGFAEMPEDQLEELKQRALRTLTPDGAAFLQKHDARKSLVIQSLIRKVCA